MFKRSALIFLLSGAALLTNAVITAQASDPLKDCISQRQELRDKIEGVSQIGDSTRLANIQQELGTLETRCTTLGLHSTQGSEVSEAQLNVSARKKNLLAALGGGDANRIAVNQKLLSKARKTLEQVESQPARS